MQFPVLVGFSCAGPDPCGGRVSEGAEIGSRSNTKPGQLGLRRGGQIGFRCFSVWHVACFQPPPGCESVFRRSVLNCVESLSTASNRHGLGDFADGSLSCFDLCSFGYHVGGNSIATWEDSYFAHHASILAKVR